MIHKSSISSSNIQFSKIKCKSTIAMKYLYLVISQIFVGCHFNKVIAGPFEVSSHSPISSPILENNIGSSGTKYVEKPNTQRLGNDGYIGTPETHPLRIHKGFHRGRRLLDKEEQYNQVSMHQSLNLKRKEIQQDELSAMGSQDICKQDSGQCSNVQEITLFGKRIKVNPDNTVNIRNFITQKMNRLCMFYARYLVEEFTYAIRHRLKSAKEIQYQEGSLKDYHNSLFAPFVYFILLRDPKKSVWYRLVAITSHIMVEFHKQESSSGKVCSTEKLHKFMLWHTEMMYHLTNPKLLDHLNSQEEMFTQKSKKRPNRGKFSLSIILSLLSNESSFERFFQQKLTYRSNLAASYLQTFWHKDYEHHYPESGPSDSPPFSIEHEWNKISKSILGSCTSSHTPEFFAGLHGLNPSQPIIGTNLMMLPLKITENQKELKHDLFEIKEILNQDDLRKDLSEIRQSNIYQGLKQWMQMHEKQGLVFSDPFCVTAVFNFLNPKITAINLNSFWKGVEEDEKLRQPLRASHRHYYQVAKSKAERKKNTGLPQSSTSQSQKEMLRQLP
ncbi:hypothetical protein DFH28DRAFT_526495 [Melampsora americana]|nr:hypothetical protein DFH28DRAFT_526495 [Melampsora americana]